MIKGHTVTKLDLSWKRPPWGQAFPEREDAVSANGSGKITSDSTKLLSLQATIPTYQRICIH